MNCLNTRPTPTPRPSPRNSKNGSSINLLQIKETKIKNKICYLNVLTLFSLISTGILCATFGYLLLQRNEEIIYQKQYHSLVNNLHKIIL